MNPGKHDAVITNGSTERFIEKILTLITFRAANPREADTLTKIAIASKRHWGYSDDMINLWAPELTFTRKSIESNFVTVAVSDGTLIGVSALELDSTRAELVGLWVLPSWIGNGVGRRLLNRVLKTAAEKGYDAITVVSDPNAAAFYMRMGGYRVGSVESTPPGRMLPQFEISTTPQKHRKH